MKRTLSLVAALGLVALLGGCKSNCQVVCEERKECIDADLDVVACASTCGNKSEESKDYTAKVEECAQCVETRTCAEQFKSCVDDCFGV